MNVSPHKFRTAVRMQMQSHGWKFPFVALHRVGTCAYRKSFGARTFQFRGKAIPYLYHPYVLTVERAVEVPIVMDALQGNMQKDILEVGNVLSQFHSFPHDVVDKYERSAGVINEDIVNYKPAKRYDLIVTISTLEHVGWDEEPKDRGKFARAVESLKGLLKLSGQLIATVPMGYNPWLDELIKGGQTGFSEVRFLKRITKDNRWEEVSLGEVQNVKFGEPFTCANGLAVGYFTKQ